ncbi:MAG: histidinol-phosphatase [Pseudomonadota bacterium]
MSANYPRKAKPARVSVHGGHSGQFCTHARDHLEEIIVAYINQGFSWVGITEHMPPMDDRFRYPDEIEEGLTAGDLYRRFGEYMKTCRSLQQKYAPEIHIAVGFETETYSGATAFIEGLLAEFQPDYMVGSVHHVNDINFDFGKDPYARATAAAGGLDALYRRYFDTQYEMITELRPTVVGHFDLIRIFDPAYRSRLEQPEIRKKILRNLVLIQELGLILDLNVRALFKGASEPYISRSILKEALRLGIPVIPGDDSHGVDTVGYGITEGIELLVSIGFDTDWRLP